MTKYARIAMMMAVAAGTATPAFAQIISSSEPPCLAPACTSGGYGYDICTLQSMAIMMYPIESARLERVSLWMFDLDSTTRDPVVVTVRDGNFEGPSNRILETLTFVAPATRLLEPQMVTVQSVARPVIHADQAYWLVVESSSAPGTSSSWAAARSGGGVFTSGYSGRWNQIQWGSWGAHMVEGSAVGRTCAADVDDGTGSGRPDGGVNVEDLTYYLRVLSGGELRADMDDGSGNGVRDGAVGIEDLLYYLQRYESGC